LNIVGIDDLSWEKNKGLIPVVVQDFSTQEVLMVAYTNREALQKTIRTGYAHYWSRSRQKLWRKGETSGNVQKVKDISVDCDKDTLLFHVEQKGVACHTGNRTCFSTGLGFNKR
jgi:phosphoribosyl-ATP pyrophosphohydrolase/phosphoribosyl-AMP cyclohydrolase